MIWRPWVSLHTFDLTASRVILNRHQHHHITSGIQWLRKKINSEMWRPFTILLISWRNSKQNYVNRYSILSCQASTLPLSFTGSLCITYPLTMGGTICLLDGFYCIVLRSWLQQQPAISALSWWAWQWALRRVFSRAGWSKLEQSTVCMLQQYCYALYPAEWAALEL